MNIIRSKRFFILALLLHLLLFLSFTVVLTWQAQHEEMYQPFDPNLQKKLFTVLPAYFSPGVTEEETRPQNLAKPTQEEAVTGIKKTTVVPNKTALSSKPKINREPATAERTSQDPLLKLLYNATGEKLVYPAIAHDLGVKGTVRVKFLVYPNGQLSNISLVKTSGFGFFDDAVLAAVRAMSPVNGVSLYLTEPKYVTAVIVFGVKY